MKKCFLFTLLAVAAIIVSCTKGEELDSLKGNPDDLHVKPITPPESPDGVVINEAVFELLNLDYPGLEQVKAYYEAGSPYQAAYELLSYYRNRSHVINPDVSFNPDCSADDINRATQATKAQGWRFYVQNYQETEGDTPAENVYWSFADKDGNIDWDFCPEDVTASSEWKQKYRMQWMAPQAKVYGSTKDETYVQDWMAAITSFMPKYTYKNEDGSFKNFGNGANTGPWEGLQTSARLAEMLTAFEYYVRSESMTPEFLVNVLGYIHDHVGSMLANPWHVRSSNITFEQEAAKLKTGMYMPEFKDASTWLHDASASLIDVQFNEDGVHNEFDLSYHIGVLATCINIYKAAKLNNVADRFPADYLADVKKAAYFVQDMIYPSGNPDEVKYTLSSPYYTVEGFNDTRREKTQGNVIFKNLKEYHQLFPEGDFLYMATNPHEGKEPSADLKLYPVSGYYMFRTGWNPEDMVLIHKNNNDPKEIELGQHNQPDNGTIGLYRNKRAFMPDAGVSAYVGSSELNAKREEYASLSNHSTMSLGNTGYKADSKYKREGKFLASGKSGNTEYLVTENAGYDNLTHRRTIFFVNKTFFVLVDEGYGDAALEGVQLKFMLSSKDDVIYDDDNTWPFHAHTKYADNNNMAYITFVSDDVTKVESKGNSSYYIDNVYTKVEDINSNRVQRANYSLKVNKPAGKAARFITVIYPIGAPGEYSSLGVNAEFNEEFKSNEVSVKVTVKGQSYNLVCHISNN